MCSGSAWASRSRRAAYSALAFRVASSAVKRWAASVAWPSSRSSRAAWSSGPDWPSASWSAPGLFSGSDSGLSLGLGVALGWPGLARGDGGLVLALDGPVHGGEVGFELAPPIDHGLRSVFGFGLPLSGCLLRELPPLQFGFGSPACFPPAAGVSGPCLVAGVRGFELLALGGHVAGERRRTCPSGLVTPDFGVGGLLPGVGLGLGGEP